MFALSLPRRTDGTTNNHKREDATMKITLLLLLGLLLLFVPGCDPSTGVTGITSQTVDQMAGTIDGDFALPAGVGETAANIRVGLYRSMEEFNNHQPAKVTTTDEYGRYFFTEVCCGYYFIDAWKDRDANGLINAGDLYLANVDRSGCGSLCQVSSGVPATFCGQLCVVN
jgi:hypothetical protein